MMVLKRTIVICSILFISAISASIIVHGVSVNNTNTNKETIDFIDVLEPYQKAFDNFNIKHDTDYGFMTDEQLTSLNIDRQEYWSKMVESYSGMNIDEFNHYLEDMYNNDSIKTKTLPYFEPEISGETIEFETDSNLK